MEIPALCTSSMVIQSVRGCWKFEIFILSLILNNTQGCIEVLHSFANFILDIKNSLYLALYHVK